MRKEDLETVIGLEVHVELATQSKVFCRCSTAFGAPPNTHVCPICLGMPGVLPVLNKKALEYTLRAALALNCEIASFSKFDRKNYFYPDLPKAYQISQYDQPLAENGYVDIEVNGEPRRIRIKRVHLEEDAGKLLHAGDIAAAATSLVDFNRSGVPLIEIVSEPDIRSPEEARLYLTKLKTILQYLGVSDCKMEEGSLRCDANLSVRPRGSEKFGTKTELKNLNSFRAVFKGLEYEEERQKEAVAAGEVIVQETRHWDEARSVTVSMRGKEEAHDYRYFPDPDLVPVVVDRAWVEEIRRSLPELPDARRARFMREYGLPAYDAEVLTASRSLADFYDECVRLLPDPKAVSNWLMSEALRLLNAEGKDIAETPLTPQHLAKLLTLVKKGTISGKIAKDVFEELFKTGADPEEIVKQRGLVQISDEGELGGIVDQVIAANPAVVADYRGGKEKALTFLVGQVMKATRGKANPAVVNKLLKEKLS
ncbi:MAG TPA: Asp-tRNA(Asn)/Glu-tRNA(Gln) amidotransferase subunit GatB [Firmicutes bacterium]|uniref:Asp-tRNA(Asn)/Glu-tRNA(Gln) amidotransferase subunit GatB n=1 Tax=Gelria sp. Kuro-4 TaxID=2796927 RepID=UPI0019CDCDA0|nr:Asp-tRNA(Asn)/Glu-tRNA(Gln) amidotransferase subunit GatB [Gelria sp. Kuro-4]MDK2927222.1 aspartyl-tRNA(Asn)/glutamyl-tRNA(Gln) amidotransferase subunit [Bacillota bacterium]BCV25423.1 aspartyl/glutamyl-tRNA(Asn/Gln) amidotransferase subunit B [Gelria sp. Kuro-4]HHV58296.1 Asp-tRNA(Asn)/Glu-tRNA(Gln) amidotransferase subunit GatB [Bacillota bacterium]